MVILTSLTLNTVFLLCIPFLILRVWLCETDSRVFKLSSTPSTITTVYNGLGALTDSRQSLPSAKSKNPARLTATNCSAVYSSIVPL